MPPFNPFKLYANTAPVGTAERPEDGQQDASAKIVELLGGTIPSDDGQELSAEEVAGLIGRSLTAATDPAVLRPGFAPETQGPSAGDVLAERSGKTATDASQPNTSTLAKSKFEAEETVEDLEGREVRVVRAQRGDTLVRILQRMGAETWAARAMSDAARSSLPDGAPQPGQEVHVTLVPSVVRANRMEPIRFSVFGDAQDHKVTVTRNAAGEFVASASPIDKTHHLHRASRRRPAAGLEPLRQPALCRRAPGHPGRRHPPDHEDPRLRDGLPPARARGRRLRVLLRRQGGGQGRRRESSASCSPPPSPRPARTASSTASARPTAPSTTTTTRATPRASS